MGLLSFENSGFCLKLLYKMQSFCWDHFYCSISNIIGSSNQINTLIGSTVNFCFILILTPHFCIQVLSCPECSGHDIGLHSPKQSFKCYSKSGQLVSAVLKWFLISLNQGSFWTQCLTVVPKDKQKITWVLNGVPKGICTLKCTLLNSALLVSIRWLEAQKG